MPKNEIDYSNTIIYKIICRDASIADVYVGHTTNFVQRKHAHKQGCINNNCKLYEVIRANGGWSNWKMEIINFFECKDHYEARKKEQEYFISLGATLNSIEPLPKPKVVISNDRIVNLNDQVVKSDDHVIKLEGQIINSIDVKTPKNASKLSCEYCHFECSKKSDWARHIATRKHMSLTKITPITPYHICTHCGKEYKSREGLWYHKKKCTPSDDENVVIQTSPDEVKNLTSMVIELMKSNSELQKQMLEVCKHSSVNNSHNHINSHNKTFNLQFFLNEQCKDAMNISEFVDTFDLQLSDLESVGELGYVEGITRIILNKLNAMDIYKRPMHCSDVKREILYVKDEDKWEKEQRSNPKLREAIKDISFKNMKLAVLWSDTYPDSKSSESRLNDVYMKLIIQSTGGSGEIVDSENKIIRRIAKEIFIDKKEQKQSLLNQQ